MGRLILLIVLAVLWNCESGGSDPEINNPEPSHAQIKAGCYSASYAGFGQSQMGCGILNTFGDATLDQGFQQEIQYQNQFWTGMQSTVYLFDECAGVENALSFPQGYILFGRNLTMNILYTFWDLSPAAGVLAHEYAHQIQFRLGFIDQNASTARRSELEADAFAGFYLAVFYRIPYERATLFFRSLASKGDFAFNDRGHHGTPQERAQAGALGWQTGYQSVINNQPYTYQDLHQYFTSIIGKHILKTTPNQSLKQDQIAQIEKGFLDRIDGIEAPQIPPNNNQIDLRPTLIKAP